MGKLTQIETFALVAEKGSLAGAARELGISAPAVSKQISRLEEELGIELMSRTTRRLELTDFGRRYLHQCHRVLEELREASVLAKEQKASPQGPLKIVSGRHFAATYIVPHLSDFLKLYPEIHLHLELAERMPDMEAEGVDLLVGMSLSAEDNCIQKRIGSTRYAICGSPDYFERFGRPTCPSELSEHRYITHSMRQPNDLVALRDGETVKVNPYLYVNDADTMTQFARQGLGVIMLHRYTVLSSLNEGSLQEVLQEYVEPELPIYVAFPQRRYIPTKVRCFVDFITDLVNG